MKKNTKLVCTIGPATNNIQTLVQLAQAGMNVARLNCSHGSHEMLTDVIKNVRAAEKKTGLLIALLLDLQGPKIRLGKLPEDGFAIKPGDKLILSTAAKIFDNSATTPIIPVQYKDLHKDVKAGDIILIEDGLIELKVDKVVKTEIHCQSVAGNTLKSNKGINVPTASISANPLSKKDIDDLEFGLKMGVDFVALSFVRKAEDIDDLRARIIKQKSNAKIIAKIERHEAVKQLEEIIEATDGVMVARGDLGVEVPAKEVPLIQKQIIALSNHLGKPVIVATEVMQSMISQSRPTRAEVSDAANGILDGADALMTSNETAVGKYPVKTVETMASIAETVEATLSRLESEETDIAENDYSALAISASRLSSSINAKFLVVFDHDSLLSQQISKARSFTETVIITDNLPASRQLALVWGLDHIFFQKISTGNLAESAKKTLVSQKLAKKGDKIVVVSALQEDSKGIMILTI